MHNCDAFRQWLVAGRPRSWSYLRSPNTQPPRYISCRYWWHLDGKLKKASSKLITVLAVRSHFTLGYVTPHCSVRKMDCSVRKVVSWSKFTEQNFSPVMEQNFQMCAKNHAIPISCNVCQSNTVCVVLYTLMSLCWHNIVLDCSIASANSVRPQCSGWEKCVL